MNREKLIKFRAVLDSPMWTRLEEDYLKPELERLRNQLEKPTTINVDFIRGEISLIRTMLDLRHYAITAEQDKE